MNSIYLTLYYVTGLTRACIRFLSFEFNHVSLQFAENAYFDKKKIKEKRRKMSEKVRLGSKVTVLWDIRTEPLNPRDVYGKCRT